MLSGTGAFGTTAITNPSSSPDLSAAIGAAGALVGGSILAYMPGPLGMSINQLIQIIAGPTQTAIESVRQRKN
jgi:filamentous hemagglutinin